MITFSKLGQYGQLGNQMFQYAMLVGMKYKTGYDITIDPATINNSYLFNFFTLTEYKEIPFIADKKYIEDKFSFNENIYGLEDNTDFEGYFQTEKYFKHCADVIRREFTFRADILFPAQEYLKNYIFFSNNTFRPIISMHVRRGDYLVNPNHHPTCTPEYYYEAADKFKDQDPVFICTTDDVDWVEQNIKLPHMLVTKNDLAFDMCLQSLCDHHIIANSTFSWWSAWLGRHVGKRVIAPNVWFGSALSHYDITDIRCPEWETI